MKLFKKLNKKKGMAYTYILITCLVIEIIAISILSSLVISYKANIVSKYSITANRLAESELDKNIFLIKQMGASIDTTPKIYGRYTVVLSEEQMPNSNILKKIKIEVTYKIPTFSNGNSDEKITLERLVVIN